MKDNIKERWDQAVDEFGAEAYKRFMIYNQQNNLFEELKSNKNIIEFGLVHLLQLKDRKYNNDEKN